MTGRTLSSRIARLEDARAPKVRRQYVYHLSDPPTAAEQEAIDGAVGPIIIVLHPCRTVDEWVAKHAPRGTLQ